MKMKKLNLLPLIALVLLGLSGCEKAKVQNQAAADVFVKAVINAAGDTVYAPIHSVFSYNTMTSVSVKAPDNTISQLQNFENAGNSFFNEPAVADFIKTKPAAGTYTYTVKFSDGEELPYANSLSSSVLSIANVTSLAKNAAGDSVYISWNAIKSVDFYQLKISHGTTQVYYVDNLYDNSSPKRTSLRLGFRLTSLTSGITGTYTFDLSGLLYESSAYDYLQAISTVTKNIEL